MKRRLVLLDIYKIALAFSVFWRHSVTMGGCVFSYLRSGFITRLSTNAMSAFFIVSGFALYYVYCNEELCSREKIVDFYKKRIISIYPLYIVAVVLHFLLLERDIGLNLGLLPIEITGLHSFFDNTFSYLHNGTTWFVSCIILSYFTFPIINILLQKISKKVKIVLCFLLLGFLVYSPYMFNKYGISLTYASPLFRGLEFNFGALLCSIIDFKKIKVPNIICFGISIMAFGSFILSNWYNWPLWTKYIIISPMIYFGALFRHNEKRKYKLLGILVTLSYPFYIFQDFIWSKNKWLSVWMLKFTNPHIKFLVYFVILMIISIVAIYLYQKPLQKYLKNKKMKDIFTKKHLYYFAAIILIVFTCGLYIHYYNIGNNIELSVFNKNKIIDINDFVINGSTTSRKLYIYLNNEKIDSIDISDGNFQYKINPSILSEGWNYIEFRVPRLFGINEKHRGGLINVIDNQPDVYVPDYTVESARKSNLKNRDEFYLYDDYDYYKNYIGAGNLEEGIEFHFDKDGIPQIELSEQLVYQPVFVSAYALNTYKKYLEKNDSSSREVFLKMADWFVNNHKNGALEYPVDWAIGTIELKKGWVSSMAEGRTLSVLSRAYYITKNKKYLEAGNKILNFMISSAENDSKKGTRKSLYDFTNKYDELKKYNDYFIFESHVGKPSSYCLNGNLFALLGLYDWYRLGREDYGSKKAKDNFDMGVKSIEVLLPYYDYYGWSSYGLNQYSNNDGVNLGNKYAHRCHLQLLYILWTKTNSERIKEYVDRFLNYYQDDFWIQSNTLYKKTS